MFQRINLTCMGCGSSVGGGADMCGDCARAASSGDLATDLRARVGISSMDSMPAHYTATLRDGGQLFRASGTPPSASDQDERATINRLVDRVVAQALAARKAGG